MPGPARPYLLPRQPDEHIALRQVRPGQILRGGTVAVPHPRTSPASAAAPRWRGRPPAAPPPARPAWNLRTPADAGPESGSPRPPAAPHSPIAPYEVSSCKSRTCPPAPATRRRQPARRLPPLRKPGLPANDAKTGPVSLMPAPIYSELIWHGPGQPEADSAVAKQPLRTASALGRGHWGSVRCSP